MGNEKKVLTAVSSVVLAMSLAACGSPTINQSQSRVATQSPNSKYQQDCKKWVENSDGSYTCKDSSSSHYNHYLYNNALYGSLSALRNSEAYKKNNSGIVSGGGSKNNSKTESSSSSKSPSSKSSSFFGKSGFSSGGASHGTSAS